MRKAPLAVVSIFMLSAAFGQEAVTLPAKPKSPRAGRVLGLREVFRISHAQGGFFFKNPENIQPAPDGGVLVVDEDEFTVLAYIVTLASGTETSGITYAGAYLASFKHDGVANTAKIWGEYSVPVADAETVQAEQTAKFNYANNLFEDSNTPAGYSGTGTEDTDIQIALSTGFAAGTAEWYRTTVTTANGDTPVFTVTRSGGTAVRLPIPCPEPTPRQRQACSSRSRMVLPTTLWEIPTPLSCGAIPTMQALRRR